jgi:hypothetical protein
MVSYHNADSVRVRAAQYEVHQQFPDLLIAPVSPDRIPVFTREGAEVLDVVR